MIYIFNKKELVYKNITIPLTLSLLLIFGTFLRISYLHIVKCSKVTAQSCEAQSFIIKERSVENTFTKENLKSYLTELNVKYPHIVMAQSEIETGHYSSTIFKENHNLFGMKEAKLRPTTAKGTNNNHAYYKNWRESCQDYALYQASYLKNIKTEEEYLQYLKQNYAQDSSYINKIISIIRKK